MNEVFTFLGIFSHDHGYILVSHTLLASFIVYVIARMATMNMQLVPKGAQNLMEVYLEGIMSMGTDTLGAEKARKYLPLVATLGLIIFMGNLIGIVPGFESPTANWNFTLPLALIVFFYYNYEGIKAQGFINYFKHFMGPVPILAPLMFPIEIVSHLSRIVSLSFRLFGNIKGDDMFLMVLLMLVPWLFPLLPFAILLFMAFLQTFVFCILTYVYLAGATEVEDH
jgi:F-type H+-transporting ATPase subunit a